MAQRYYYREKINEVTKKFIPALPENVFCFERDEEATAWEKTLTEQTEKFRKIARKPYDPADQNFIDNMYIPVNFRILQVEDKCYKAEINNETHAIAFISKKICVKVSTEVVGVKKWFFDKIAKYL